MWDEMTRDGRLAESCLIDGTARHETDVTEATHNPWVVGSIPTRPTTVELV